MLKETVAAYNLPKCIWPIDNFDQPVFFSHGKRFSVLALFSQEVALSCWIIWSWRVTVAELSSNIKTRVILKILGQLFKGKLIGF